MEECLCQDDSVYQYKIQACLALHRTDNNHCTTFILNRIVFITQNVVVSDLSIVSFKLII